MSDESGDRTFERWALAGAGVLALAGILAFLARRDAPDELPAAPDAPRESDLLHVRIGGERPAARDDRAASDDGRTRVAPDPGRTPPPAPPPPEPEPAARRTVVVQPGETLGQIAQRELGTVGRLDEILELNGITDADRVRAGTELILPPR